MEDGVEVVVNHLEPYQVKGKPSNLILEKVSSFDTEKDDIAATGLTDIYRFDVDSEGNIYFLIPPKGQGNLIYKFDRNGNFITSFGRRGQGPFEFEYPYYMRIINNDKILIIEPSKRKFYIFSKDGIPIKETPLNQGIDNVIPLENGKYLILFWHTQDMEAKYFSLSLNLYSSKFKEIKELDRFRKFPNRMIAEKIAEKIYFPKYWYPFYSFFPDDEGRLFVMTYEEGENPGEYIFDIFNSDGIFIARKSLKYSLGYARLPELHVKAKMNHLYCAQKKDSGYKELVVYKMMWE